MTVYRVKDWERWFESAKSKTFKNKTQAYIPRKQNGLGYNLLLGSKNGEAIYGAWCALVIFLSGHSPPRSGWLTDGGAWDGRPLTPSDLELTTRIKAATFEQMLALCSSETIGWISTYNHKDSLVSCQSPELSLSPVPVPIPDTITHPRSDSVESVHSRHHIQNTHDADIIYAAYPRKVAKPAAVKAIQRALRKASPIHLLERTKAYALATADSDPQFIPYPATWFNQQRYNDDPATWGSGNGKPSKKALRTFEDIKADEAEWEAKRK